MATPGQKRLRPNDDVGEGGTSGAGSPGDRRGSSMDVDNPNNDANNDSTMDDNFMYGRVKIRSRHGANQVRRWPRDKILLFLKDLPADFDEQWSQNPAFTQPVEQALRDAIEGPDAMMNLNELGAEPDCARVLGNEAAGRLLEPIFGKHRQLEVSGSATRERVDRIKRHLPLVPEGNGAMDGKLATLAPDASNADWLFDLLRNASRMWLDVRFRHLRDVGRYTADGGLDSRTVRLPPTLQVRGELINGMVHGGDVRMDALMCQLDFGYARYEHATYTPFLENAFRNTYGMTSEKAVWLSKYGHQDSNGVKWMKYIQCINTYVFSRLAVLQERAQNRTRLSMGDIHTYLFINLTDTLVELITFAERSPNSNASRNLITKADQFQDALERGANLRLLYGTIILGSLVGLPRKVTYNNLGFKVII